MYPVASLRMLYTPIAILRTGRTHTLHIQTCSILKSKYHHLHSHSCIHMLTVICRRDRFLWYREPHKSYRLLSCIPRFMKRALDPHWAGRVLRESDRILFAYVIFECSVSFRQIIPSAPGLIEPRACICGCESEVGEENMIDPGRHACAAISQQICCHTLYISRYIYLNSRRPDLYLVPGLQLCMV